MVMRTARIVLLSVTLLLLSPSVECVRYRYYCELKEESIVTLEWQYGGYVIPGAAENASAVDVEVGGMDGPTVAPGNFDTKDNTTENYNYPATIQARKCPCWHPRLFDNSTSALSTDFYCPTYLTHCGVPVRSRYQYDEQPPGCVNVEEQTKFVRSIWPMLVISYAFLTTFLICSRPGRNVLGCCFSLVLPNNIYNSWNAERIVTQRPSTANGIILRYLRDEQEQRRREEEAAAPPSPNNPAIQEQSPWTVWGQRLRRNSEYVLELGPDEWGLLVRDPATAAVMEALNSSNNNHNNSDEPTPPVPTALKLKTRVYQTGDYDFPSQEGEGFGLSADSDPEHGIELANLGTTSADNDNDEEKVNEDDDNSSRHHHSCTICYAPIEDGQRVGALPTCDHIFHVECLKSWLTRRNVCPLCLSEDVAAPQYGDQNTSSNSADEETPDATAETAEPDGAEQEESRTTAPMGDH